MKKIRFYAISLTCALLLSGCGSLGNDSGSGSNSISVDPGDNFSNRDLDFSYDETKSASILLKNNSATSDSASVKIDGSVITITGEGTYIVSGTLSDGMIVVEADKEDKIQLVLDAVTIHSDNSAPIYVKTADKVFITLAADSKNTLSNGGSFTQIDENNIDAVIFSKEDLTLNGEGSLTIDSPAGHGIVSKDDLVITGGTYFITASSHGLSANDTLNVTSASLTVDAGKDGLHAENDEDTSLGNLFIESGNIVATASGDGLSASGTLTVLNGTFSLEIGGGSKNASSSTSNWGMGFGRWSSGSSNSSNDTSSKGIKATSDLAILGGVYTIDSADDGIHSNANVSISGGTFDIASGDDGFHADDNLSISGGVITISESYEGLEGHNIDITGGTISLYSSDDGLNAAGGNDQSGFGGFRGNDIFASDADSYINISGGTLYVNADGDGIDSNGSLTVSGGETVIAGPTNSANGALDYASNATITGGIIVAAGASGMAVNFTSAKNQGVMMVSTGSQNAGSTITLTDSDGNVIFSWTAGKSYSSVVLSCPEIQKNKTYTLTIGSTIKEITMNDLIYGGSSGFGGTHGNGGRGQGGGRGW